MVYIHVPHKHDHRKATPHERAIALYIVAFLVLAFAIVAVTAGPKHGSPPPPIVFWVLVALFISTALRAFFSWLSWQGEDHTPSQDSDSGEEK